ncbi:MAG: T9SS type A sorting domain-containing protein [Chitinophagaceae bacterium]|nr:T9SS type A sorting domain-containing protein [Chitinophagaceae bacterium]
MKKLNLILMSCMFLLFARNNAQAQLNAGDIVFTGYNSSATNVDSFSFVLLVNIPAGTQISFTDNAWLSTGAFRAGEQHLTWTAGQAFVAGREITIFGTTSPTPLTPNSLVAFTSNSAGTCSGTMVSLNTSGDQIIAYQGTVASPTIIAGIHMNVYAVTGVGDCGNTTAAAWDPVCVDGAGGTVGNGNWSSKPAALTTGTNAVWIGSQDVTASEEDWAVFNCTGPLATPAQVRAAVNNNANWFSGDGATTRRTSPSRCTFLGLLPLPIKLNGFSAQLNSDKTVTVKWKVDEQQDVVSYIVERSTDGVSFSQTGVVFPAVNTDTYSFIDANPVAGKNYYRLFIKEASGKITYSRTVIVSLKAGIVISLYPNPVKDKLTIQQFGTLQSRTALLTDGQGKTILTIRLTSLVQTVSMERFGKGIYMLKLDDGSSYKIVKE